MSSSKFPIRVWVTRRDEDNGLTHIALHKKYDDIIQEPYISLEEHIHIRDQYKAEVKNLAEIASEIENRNEALQAENERLKAVLMNLKCCIEKLNLGESVSLHGMRDSIIEALKPQGEK